MTAGSFRTSLALGFRLVATVFALVTAPMAKVQQSHELMVVERTVVTESAPKPISPPAAAQKFKTGYVEFED